jgi:hypothetical protein
LIQSGERPER